LDNIVDCLYGISTQKDSSKEGEARIYKNVLTRK